MNQINLNIRRFELNKAEDQKTRLITGLGYLWALFFVPLVARPESKAGKHCANQGLTLLILYVALQIAKAILNIIPIVRIFTNIVFALAIVAAALYALYAYYEYYQKGVLMELPYSLKFFK